MSKPAVKAGHIKKYSRNNNKLNTKLQNNCIDHGDQIQAAMGESLPDGELLKDGDEDLVGFEPKNVAQCLALGGR